jgi:hypothetical protein
MYNERNCILYKTTIAHYEGGQVGIIEYWSMVRGIWPFF